MTRRPVVSDTKYLTTSTMTRNKNNYKWCTSCENGQGAWGFHWKDGHEEWKNKQGNKPSVRFSNPANNTLIYYFYLMNTSEESTEEEAKGGNDSQNNDFISLSRFELLELLLKRACYPLMLYFYYFIMSTWSWISIERESCWIWSLRKSFSQCHNNLVLVPPLKPPDPVKDLYDG